MVSVARGLKWQSYAYLLGRSTFEPTITHGMFCSGRKSLILSKMTLTASNDLTDAME